jgi:threonine dehydrogenase-like Zn-dependent dehydrogenase
MGNVGIMMICAAFVSVFCLIASFGINDDRLALAKLASWIGNHGFSKSRTRDRPTKRRLLQQNLPGADMATLATSLCQRLGDLAGMFDEEPSDRTEGAVVQSDDAD